MICIVSKQCALLSIAVMMAIVCFSQKQTIAGLSLTAENTSSADLILGIGATLERQFTTHDVLETGLYYRTFEVHQTILINGSDYDARDVEEQYLSVPVLYKYKSSVFNFSAGQIMDIYVGWKQINKGNSFGQEYSTNRKLCIGLLGKVSKTIPLYDRLLFEPEIRCNPIFTITYCFMEEPFLLNTS